MLFSVQIYIMDSKFAYFRSAVRELRMRRDMLFRADRKKEFTRRYEDLKNSDKYTKKKEVIINRKPLTYLWIMAGGKKYRGSRASISQQIEEDLLNEVEDTFYEFPYYPLSRQDPFYFPKLGSTEEWAHDSGSYY